MFFARATKQTFFFTRKIGIFLSHFNSISWFLLLSRQNIFFCTFWRHAIEIYIFIKVKWRFLCQFCQVLDINKIELTLVAYKEAHLCQHSLIWVLTFIEPCTDDGEIREYCLWATRYVLRIVLFHSIIFILLI